VAKGGELRDCAYTILFEKVTACGYFWNINILLKSLQTLNTCNQALLYASSAVFRRL